MKIKNVIAAITENDQGEYRKGGLVIEVLQAYDPDPSVEVEFPLYTNAAELRRAAKFLKALADSLDARFPKAD